MSNDARPDVANTINKVTWKERLKAIGPGAFVAAGIIGPGTVTTFTVVGADWRYASLWIIVLAAIIGYVFMAPAVKLASVSDDTLMEATRKHVSKSAAIIMFVAAFIGALAFQAGNFVGAGMAVNALLPGLSIQLWATVTALIALVIVWVGVYRLIENLMTAMVVLMVLAFVITAIGSRPLVTEVVVEGFQFSTLGGDWMLIGALLATTVVPTGALALSSMAKRRRESGASADRAREATLRKLKLGLFDLRLNTILVALIGIAIIVTSGTVIYMTGGSVTSAADMAEQLTPVLGRYAGVLFALGLFAAGISSGLYHASLQPVLLSEALGRPYRSKDGLSRVVAAVVLIVPIGLLWIFGQAPVQLIVTAQALNAIVLPLVTIIIAILVRKTSVFGSQRYTGVQYIALVVVAVVTVALGARVLIGFFL